MIGFQRNTRYDLILKESELLSEEPELLSLALAAADVGVWQWDRSQSFFYAHPVLLDMLGYDDTEWPDSLEGWLQYVHPLDRPSVTRKLDRFLSGQGPPLYRNCQRMIHKDGSARYFLSRVMIVDCIEDEPSRIVGADIDITELMPEPPDEVHRGRFAIL